MARRGNTTTQGGLGSGFDNEPISSGAGGGVDGGSEGTSGGDVNGLLTIDPSGIGHGGNGGDGDNGGSGFGVNRDGTPAKKRGRKPGQKNGTGAARATVSVSGLEKSLIAIHTGLAALLKTPAWNLEKDEARALSEATANVAAHYNATIDPKWADWFVLVGLVGTLYAPRIMATVGKKKGQQTQTVETPLADVDMPFNTNLPNIGTMPVRH